MTGTKKLYYAIEKHAKEREGIIGGIYAKTSQAKSARRGPPEGRVAVLRMVAIDMSFSLALAKPKSLSLTSE